MNALGYATLATAALAGELAVVADVALWIVHARRRADGVRTIGPRRDAATVWCGPGPAHTHGLLARVPAAHDSGESFAMTIEPAVRIEAVGGRRTVEEVATILPMSPGRAYRRPRFRPLFMRRICRRVMIDPKAVRGLERRLRGA